MILYYVMILRYNMLCYVVLDYFAECQDVMVQTLGQNNVYTSRLVLVILA